MLKQCRHGQLRTIRNEITECEARLRELRRSEKLLTSPSEREAALRFYQSQQQGWGSQRESPGESQRYSPTAPVKSSFPRVQTFSN